MAKLSVLSSSGSNELAVKPINVRQVLSQCRIDLETSKTFGFPGYVDGEAVYDTLNGVYTVGRLPPGADHLAVKVKPENLLLPLHARVHAVGLASRPELNGEVGKIVMHNAESERYTVEMAATGEQVKLKFGNVVALHGYNPYVGQF